MSNLQIKSMSGESMDLSPSTVDNFGAGLKGKLIKPSDSQYDESRSIWNGMINRKPGLIARCHDATDVVSAIKFARQHNLLISIRSGGHHVAGKSVSEGGLMIDLSAMNNVDVDQENSIAIVQGGATLGDIDGATHPYNLAAPLGVVSETGVAGLTLHGGYGWLSRKYGLSLDNVKSMEIVTADGRLIKAGAEENPDLFWALRGGGGNFGVVTSFEFNLYPVEPKVWFLLTLYPVSMAKKGLQLFREYMPEAPDELSSIALFWNAPHEDFIPADYRGKPVFIYIGCYHGPAKEGEKVLAPFRQLGEPVADLSEPMPFAKVQKALDEDYPDGRNYYWKSTYLNDLSDDVIDLLIDYAGRRPSPLTSLDVWGLGGKISRIDPNSTAFYQRKSPYLIGVESNWDNPEENEANLKWTRDIYKDLTQTFDSGLYLNFPGFGEEGDALLKKTYGPNYQRLKEVKSKYDPDNFFRGFIDLMP